MSSLKTCTKCKELKPLSEFHKSKRERDGYQFRCKKCASQYAMDRHRKTYRPHRTPNTHCEVCGNAIPPQVGRGATRKYCSTSCKTRRNNLHRAYGMSQEDYRKRWDEQNGSCAICREDAEEFGALVVDHDHATGTVRGLLCGNCNTGLGLYKDDPARLGRAIDYLKLAGEGNRNGMVE